MKEAYNLQILKLDPNPTRLTSLSLLNLCHNIGRDTTEEQIKIQNPKNNEKIALTCKLPETVNSQPLDFTSPNLPSKYSEGPRETGRTCQNPNSQRQEKRLTYFWENLN
jgi:hypothetical protein